MTETERSGCLKLRISTNSDVQKKQEKSDTHVPALPSSSDFGCPFQFYWLQKALLQVCGDDAQLFQAKVMGKQVVLCFSYKDTEF